MIADAEVESCIRGLSDYIHVWLKHVGLLTASTYFHLTYALTNSTLGQARHTHSSGLEKFSMYHTRSICRRGVATPTCNATITLRWPVRSPLLASSMGNGLADHLVNEAVR